MSKLHDTTQDFPSGIGQVSVQIGRRNNVGGPRSPWTFAREVQEFSGQQWTMTIQTRNMRDSEARRLNAFLTSLRGSAGKFRCGDPFRSIPAGRALGAPVVAVATVGAQTLTVTGFRANVLAQLMPDDYIQIGSRLYAILHQVDSDASGNATLTVWPDLRETYSASDPVTMLNPRGLWQVVDNSTTIQRDINGRGSMTISCEEAL